MLKDSDFIAVINDRIDLFISTNTTSDISAKTIWEACKAYLRGEIISYSAYKRKVMNERRANLFNTLTVLQSNYANSPSSDLFVKLLTAKTEFDLLDTNEATEALHKTRCNYYEFGDKSSKLLAHQLRQSAASNLITQISTSNGSSVHPLTINDKFRNFYASLYTYIYIYENISEEAQFDNFFSSLNMPCIDPDISSNLAAPLTLDEVKASLSLMQSGKCPGSDGFPAEFLKTFSDK